MEPYTIINSMNAHPIHSSFRSLTCGCNVVIAATSRAQAEWQHLPGKLRNFAFDAKIFDGGPLIVDGHQKVLKESCFASDL